MAIPACLDLEVVAKLKLEKCSAAPALPMTWSIRGVPSMITMNGPKWELKIGDSQMCLIILSYLKIMVIKLNSYLPRWMIKQCIQCQLLQSYKYNLTPFIRRGRQIDTIAHSIWPYLDIRLKTFYLNNNV